MTLNPIHKALSIMLNCNVRFLVMGGQACIVYGGAEFSRDLDLCVVVDAANQRALHTAFELLQAEQIFVPGLEADALERGHACHFRCHADGVAGLRIDLMTKLRGCPSFEEMWRRRLVIALPEVGELGVLSLIHLVCAKKTQRDKDWPMIRRLIEADVLHTGNAPTDEQILFWLREARTPEILLRLATRYPSETAGMLAARPLLRHALEQDRAAVARALTEEEQREREADQVYWQPLREELERWRHGCC